MNLFSMLEDRGKAGRPVRVGLVGAGKFGTMFLAQLRHMAGVHLVGIADLEVDRARGSLRRAGWTEPQYAATSAGDAYRNGTTWLTEDANDLIASDGIEVIVEATGNPAAGVRHARSCFRNGRHVVMVNVEADALIGAMLAREAKRSGVVYSLAYGDQPALICEMVDWARASGFEVVAAGKGTKYLPAYHESTPQLRVFAGAAPNGRFQPADVQLVLGRHQVGHRNGGRGQRDGSHPATGRTGLPTGGR